MLSVVIAESVTVRKALKPTLVTLDSLIGTALSLRGWRPMVHKIRPVCREET